MCPSRAFPSLGIMVDRDELPWYTPPSFTPFEFDDSYLPQDQRRHARRWLPGFNGAKGEPAQNVQLGWRSKDGAQVGVGTYEDTPHRFGDSGARISAVLILSGLQFASPGPPVSWAVTTTVDVTELAEQDEIWHDGDVVIDGTPIQAVTADIRGFRVGYAKASGVLIAFVTGGIGGESVRVRSLPDDSADYTADPRTPLTLAEVDQEWKDFFRERPDLELA